uniref:CUB domain-containing protein n=2 Tax=Ciona intestinalis TaxID=7719 RepID=H2XP62_CIOIN
MKNNLISFVYFCCSIIIVKIQLAGAEYELSPKDALSAYGCKESVFVKQKSGIIKYNIDEPFTNLCWFITAQTQSNIVISFSYFNIQPQEELYFPPLQGNGDGDCGNYLFVQDASTKLSYVKKSKSNRFCSSFSSSDVFPIVMKTDRVLIQLVARINLSYYQVSGFSLKYSIVEKCQSNLMMERYTVVTSINFPGMYPTISCSWNITSAHKHPIEIVINS